MLLQRRVLIVNGWRTFLVGFNLKRKIGVVRRKIFLIWIFYGKWSSLEVISLKWVILLYCNLYFIYISSCSMEQSVSIPVLLQSNSKALSLPYLNCGQSAQIGTEDYLVCVFSDLIRICKLTILNTSKFLLSGSSP